MICEAAIPYLVKKPPALWSRARRALGRVIAGPRPQPQIVVAAGSPYRAGEITRLNRAWQPPHYSGDGAIQQSWSLATARIRDLARNDPAVIALKRALVDHCVSTGIGTTACVLAGRELVEDFNWESDEQWDDYAGAENEIDIEGRLADTEMQRQIFAELLETGDALALRCADADPARSIPLCYQVLESEQLDDSKDQPASAGSNEIRRGVEVDGRGRAVAYWLFEAHPADPHARWTTKSTRVPAERVIHFPLPGRPSGTRGIGLYNAIVQSAKDLDSYLGSELTSAVIQSLFTLIHKTSKPGAGLGFVGDGSTEETDEFGNAKVRLGRGIVCQIPKEDDVVPVQRTSPNASADTFIRLMLMLVGMGGGVSRYRLTRDYTGTTYVAARAAQIDDRAAFRPMQYFFGRNWSQKIRRDWTAQMAAYGRFSSVTATQFARQRRRWARLQLMLPGWELLDPDSETNSAIARIAAGISTLEIENAARGLNWRRVLMQRAREQAFARELGLDLALQRPGAAPNPSTMRRDEQAAGRPKPGSSGDGQDQDGGTA